MEPKTFINRTCPEDMQQGRAWFGRLLDTPETLPFSFWYAQQKVKGIPASWDPQVNTHRVDANIVETVMEGEDPTSGLNVRVEITQYLDFPVVEWVIWLENKSDQTSPIVQDFLALDGTFAGETPVIQHSNGDYYSFDGYTPSETLLSPGQTLNIAPTGGRSCDGAFPYFRLQFKGCGLTLAVGWPGQWAAQFSAEENGVHVTAGQEKTHLRLEPGEKIRSPRVTALAWTGDTQRAINLWRRWYLAHILPRPNGQPIQTKLACAATDTGEEFTNANEDNQIRYMDQFQKTGFDFDVWWIDAGWYPCHTTEGVRRWPQTGTWIPDPERFPRGFGAISQRAAQHGASLLIWFEPERVRPGSQLDLDHPEWLLKTNLDQGQEQPDQNMLLDLGNPACLNWLTDHVSNLIRTNGINIYRQDFNFAPLAYWRDNDAVDRQGIRENLHVQGYLHYWDELLRRNPGLWIDSCSSGGRRNDLETMRRSVPLHYTDYGYGDHAVKLAFHHTMFAWIPYFKEATLSWDVCLPGEDRRFDKQVDAFSFHCGMAPMLFASLDIRRNDYDFATAIQMITIWRSAAETMLHGDYYPLTPFSKQNDQWVIWQFDEPETQRGFIQGMRLAENLEDEITITPQNIADDSLYVFENQETHQHLEIDGATLARQGFTFCLPQRSAALWQYRVQPISRS